MNDRTIFLQQVIIDRKSIIFFTITIDSKIFSLNSIGMYGNTLYNFNIANFFKYNFPFCKTD